MSIPFQGWKEVEKNIDYVWWMLSRAFFVFMNKRTIVPDSENCFEYRILILEYILRVNFIELLQGFG